MDVLGGVGVSVPFADVEGEESLVSVRLGLLMQALQMLRQIIGKLLVQLLAEKMSCKSRGNVSRDLEEEL